MPADPTTKPVNAPPRLLIITPTLGTSAYLPETVASVRAVEGAVIHHVLVCPLARIAALRRDYPQCTVVPDQGRAGGIYGALNAGLAAAPEGWDWFTYINDDDLLAPGFSRLLARHCHPENAATVAYGDIMNIDAAGLPLGRMTVERSPRRMPALLQQRISPAGQQGMLFGSPVVKALGGYRLEFKLCADLDFWARAHSAGFRFVYYPWTLGCFRIQPGQLSGDVALTSHELDAATAASFPVQISTLRKSLAYLLYRLANAPRYLERWRAVGRLTTSETLLGSGGTLDSAGAALRPPPR